jgi:hypothetical protein
MPIVDIEQNSKNQLMPVFAGCHVLYYQQKDIYGEMM